MPSNASLYFLSQNLKEGPLSEIDLFLPRKTIEDFKNKNVRDTGVKTRKYTWALNVLKVTSFLATLYPCIISLSLSLLFCTAVLEAMLDQSGQMLQREERERGWGR